MGTIAQYLEDLEAQERVKGCPHLLERAPLNDGGETDEPPTRPSILAHCDGDNDGEETTIELSHMALKLFSLELLPPVMMMRFDAVIRLDVSNNELSELPGLSSLVNLEALSLQRNWFNCMPTEIGSLSRLTVIDASRNFFKPNSSSLRLDQLRRLGDLGRLDLSYNQKCNRSEHRVSIREALRPNAVDVLVTVWQELAEKCDVGRQMRVGDSAAGRDPVLLRSQLEPHSTVELRRRLVRDFGCRPLNPVEANRGEVMHKLLECYYGEGMLELPSGASLDSGVGRRRTIRANGSPVSREVIGELLVELRDWRENGRRGGSSNNRERPSISARCYMILRAPKLDEGNTSRRARRMAKKMNSNARLWALALEAMGEVDPQFAECCSEVAVTYGFTGSPHIDKQNRTPFYGMSLGEFTEGTGCIAVECSARVLAEINTKERLGKVDGRYPHWVTPYDNEAEERFSLIYYDTLSPFQTPGPAIFDKDDS